MRGAVKYLLDDYNGVLRDFQNALEIDPEYAFVYYFRGRVKYELDDLENACLDWRKASELGFTDAMDLIRGLCR
jgi:tetratricopeptide (TPR) repeat protein